MKKLLLVATVFVALLCGVAVLSEEEPTSKQVAPPTEEAEPKPPPQEAKPKPPPKGQWVTVTSVSGSSDKQTAPFELHGGRVRIEYSFEDTSGFGAVGGGVYLLDEGVDLNKEGGFPEVTVQESGSDVTEVTREPGRYYVKVLAANANWTVTVQELR